MLLSVDIIKDALARNDGKIKETAIDLFVKCGTLRWYINKYNIPFNNQKKLLDLNPEEVWAHYKELNSIGKVAKIYGVKNKDRIRNFLKNHGYKINKQIRYFCNDDFFKDESEKVFYWSGFIAADGCVMQKRNRGKFYDSYLLDLALSIIDKNHVKKFKNDICFDGPIFDFEIKNKGYKNSFKSEIKITSKEIFDDLAKFNIVPRKSLIYTFPEWLINHKYVNHFMRGYFDGDGSFYKSLGKGRKTPQEYFSLLGTYEFLNIFREILDRERDLPTKNKKLRKIKNIYALEYGGNGVLKQIRDFLFKDAETYLDRKWINYIGK